MTASRALHRSGRNRNACIPAKQQSGGERMLENVAVRCSGSPATRSSGGVQR
ncbi:MAG TPA: hypothetical protein VHH72_02365 [Solirubrobacterales bacterium]|jgi:hypothetical protein|nr:hypothetical protein [Solirubrobacterales bacterium]HEX2468937.1 hypothetical protein [Solirubrobacterales bacterium]